MLYFLILFMINPIFSQEKIIYITNYNDYSTNLIENENNTKKILQNIVTITNYIQTNIVSSNISITNTVVENIYINPSNIITNRLYTNIYTTNYVTIQNSLHTNYIKIEDFFQSIQNGNYDKVLNYLKLGMNPNIRRFPNSTQGITALMCSIANRRITITKLLLSYGADVNLTTTKKGITNISSLMIAAQQGPLEIVNLLIRNHANINTQTTGAAQGNTALMTAVQYNNDSIINTLLNHGANPNIKTANGITILMIATQTGNIDIVKQLLSIPNLNIHAIDFEGKNALVYAYISGNIQLISLLQQVGLTTSMSPDMLKSLIKKY